jgi:hypothetical protein
MAACGREPGRTEARASRRFVARGRQSGLSPARSFFRSLACLLVPPPYVLLAKPLPAVSRSRSPGAPGEAMAGPATAATTAAGGRVVLLFRGEARRVVPAVACPLSVCWRANHTAAARPNRSGGGTASREGWASTGKTPGPRAERPACPARRRSGGDAQPGNRSNGLPQSFLGVSLFCGGARRQNVCPGVPSSAAAWRTQRRRRQARQRRQRALQGVSCCFSSWRGARRVVPAVAWPLCVLAV